MAITVSVDNDVILTIDNVMLKVLAYNNPKAELKNILTNYISTFINNKVEDSKNALKAEWVPKIQQRYDNMPTRDLALGTLIFSQSDYKDYDDRILLGTSEVKPNR